MKTNDIVIYAHHNCNYSIGKSNPLVGTKFFTYGIKREITSVYWFNNTSNTYNSWELEVIYEN